MNELEAYIAAFKDVNLDLSNVEKKAKEFYEISTDTKKILSKIREEAHSAGILLGTIKKNDFQPTPALLKRIFNQTSNTITLNEKSSWLFICGRDIFKEGIIENTNPQAKQVLVLNEKKEILGVAKKERGQYMNQYDIGVFLRTKR